MSDKILPVDRFLATLAIVAKEAEHTDCASFAQDLTLARDYSRMFMDTYQRLREDAMARLKIAPDHLP